MITGELESVTIDLSGDELEWNTYLAYSLAVVVTDPQSRVLQVRFQILLFDVFDYY